MGKVKEAIQNDDSKKVSGEEEKAIDLNKQNQNLIEEGEQQLRQCVSVLDSKNKDFNAPDVVDSISQLDLKKLET